nr:N-(5'-phosphoribosyl)anthranilate isomerase [uncultured Litoreibacter sp.]
MGNLTSEITPDQWFRNLFSCKAAVDGGVVRRKVRDMERMVGRQRFYHEIERRGFSAIENGGQVVVFCNGSALRIVVGRCQTLGESLETNPR